MDGLMMSSVFFLALTNPKREVGAIRTKNTQPLTSTASEGGIEAKTTEEPHAHQGDGGWSQNHPAGKGKGIP